MQHATREDNTLRALITLINSKKWKALNDIYSPDLGRGSKLCMHETKSFICLFWQLSAKLPDNDSFSHEVPTY